MASSMKADLILSPKIEDGSEKDLEKQLKSSGSSSGGGFGSAFATAAKVGIKATLTAAAAAGTAIIGIGKQAFSAFADYEQLVGGVETLFKGDAAQVQAYAAQAFETAGMSANDYMEMVTGFSASLIKGLGGDTAKAAEMANTAITDMADNANKMGTPMESIQAAYQGLAKGNATMLDNLKIGYGGTQTEMLKLAKDMGVIDKRVKSFSDMSFDQAVEAIHRLQVQLGISGYSVDELNAKLADMSLTEEELTKVADYMGISYEEAFAKMKDGSLTYLNAEVLLGTTAREAAATIQGSMGAMKAAWSNLLVGVADSESDLDALVTTFTDKVSIFVDNSSKVIERIVPAIGTALPTLIDNLIGIIETNLPPLFTSIMGAIVAQIPNVAQAGVRLFSALVQQMPAIIQGIVSALPVVIDALIGFLGNTETIQLLLDSVLSGFEQILGVLPDILNRLVEVLPSIVTTIITTLIDHIPELMAGAFDLLMAIVFAIPDFIIQLIAELPNIIKSIVDKLTDEDSLNQMRDTGIEMLNGIAQGFVNHVKEAWKKFKQGLSDLWGKCKDFLGIHSPSTLFAEMGGYMMQGLAVGIEDSTKDAQDTLNASLKSLTGSATQTLQVTASAASATASGSSNGPGSITIGTLTIQADSRDTADLLFARIRQAAAMA